MRGRPFCRRARRALALATLGAATSLAAAPRLAHAGQATCSNPSLPPGTSTVTELTPGRLTLSWTTSLLPIWASETVEERDGLVRNDTRLLSFDSRLAAEYAVTPWLAFTIAAPYRVIDVELDQAAVAPGAEPPGGSIHVRSERLHGPGDVSVGAHLARELGRVRLHLRLGTSLPLGSTVENPHLLGQLGQDHQHVQLGTGTFIPYLAAELAHDLSPRVSMSGWALAQPSLYENGEGFQAGDRYSGGATATLALARRRWVLGLALEAHGETAETWRGRVYRDEGNAGRLDLLAGATASFRASSAVVFTSDFRYAAQSWARGTQVDYGVVASLGVSVNFDLRRKASWRGADHRALGPAGSAAPLAPVPGKITVIDLWAEWCAPCRELDERLAELARVHPDRLAVRKLDVVDPDSPAWTAYLAPGQYALPHVKVYGTDGRLLFERTAPAAQLIRDIAALLR